MSPVTKIYMLDVMTDISVIQTGKAQRAFIRLLQVLEAQMHLIPRAILKLKVSRVLKLKSEH